MQHTIPVETLGANGAGMAQAVGSCVHCGFCLPACPTYVALGEEMNSPRGRIVLMKGALEGAISFDEALPHVDKCLGCMACTTACPSGVQYDRLLTPFRAMAETKRRRSVDDRLARWLMRMTLPYPDRFRVATALGKLGALFRRVMPESIRAMHDVLPPHLPARVTLPHTSAARGKRRGRVALAAGCVQQALAPRINQATLAVLTHNGVEVIVPPGQGCCGSLFMHNGDAGFARALALQNLKQINLSDVDAVVTNAAGCGSGMKHYNLLFDGTPHETPARQFSDKVQDVSEYLAALGMVAATVRQSMRLAYHDACHLAHAQGIVAAPRALLRAIDGLEVIEVSEPGMCCGSAGTYNLEQPQLAQSMGERKAQSVLRAGPDAVATGNIGCMMQIQTHLRRLGSELPVWHTMEVLAKAYGINN